MPSRGSRYIPLLVIGALVIALGVYLAPGILRAWRFRSTVNALLADVKANHVDQVKDYAVPSQRAAIDLVLSRWDAKTYVPSIKKLSLYSYEAEGSQRIWAIVVAKWDSGHGAPEIGEGKLLWVFDGRQWQLDLLGSFLAPYSTSGEPDWVSVKDYGHVAGIGEE